MEPIIQWNDYNNDNTIATKTTELCWSKSGIIRLSSGGKFIWIFFSGFIGKTIINCYVGGWCVCGLMAGIKQLTTFSVGCLSIKEVVCRMLWVMAYLYVSSNNDMNRLGNSCIDDCVMCVNLLWTVYREAVQAIF